MLPCGIIAMKAAGSLSTQISQPGKGSSAIRLQQDAAHRTIADRAHEGHGAAVARWADLAFDFPSGRHGAGGDPSQDPGAWPGFLPRLGGAGIACCRRCPDRSVAGRNIGLAPCVALGLAVAGDIAGDRGVRSAVEVAIILRAHGQGQCQAQCAHGHGTRAHGEDDRLSHDVSPLLI